MFWKTTNAQGTGSAQARLEIPQSAETRAIVVTADGGSAGAGAVRVAIACSGNNREAAAHGSGAVGGRVAASATQIFQLDPGFTGWVEARATADRPDGAVELHLSVAALP